MDSRSTASERVMRWLPTGILAMVMLTPSPGAGDPDEDSVGLEAASDTCLDAAIDAIQSRYDRVDDLRADFVQVTRTAVLPGSRASVSAFAAPPQ